MKILLTIIPSELKGSYMHLSSKWLFVVLSFLMFAFILPGKAVFAEPTHTTNSRSPIVEQSVTTTANCIEGHFIRGQVKRSSADVEIVDAVPIDCTADGQCRAWQVTAQRSNNGPFNIDVVVTCTEDGINGDYERTLKQLTQ